MFTFFNHPKAKNTEQQKIIDRFMQLNAQIRNLYINFNDRLTVTLNDEEYKMIYNILNKSHPFKEYHYFIGDKIYIRLEYRLDPIDMYSMIEGSITNAIKYIINDNIIMSLNKLDEYMSLSSEELMRSNIFYNNLKAFPQLHDKFILIRENINRFWSGIYFAFQDAYNYLSNIDENKFVKSLEVIPEQG